VHARDMLARKDAEAPALVSVSPETTARAALALITQYDIAQLPVCRDGRCVGSLTESVLMARVIEDPSVLDRSVEILMDAPFPSVSTEEPLPSLARMLTRQNPAVVVMGEDGALVGIVTRYDMVRYLTN
jgi:cystathionine beta-synthase